MRARASRTVWLVVWPFLLTSSSGHPDRPRSAAAGRAAALHELHETYADIAIEGAVIGARVLFYKQQLERALGPLVDADEISLRAGTEADVLVLRYLRDRLTVRAGEAAPRPVLLRSGEEEVGHHMGWWVIVQWRFDAPVEDLRVGNTLLFELHDDQRNVMKVVRLPGGTPRTFTTVPGAGEVVVAPDTTVAGVRERVRLRGLGGG